MSQIDFTTVTPNGPPRDKFADPRQRRWWLLKGEECADAISATLNLLKDNHRARVAQHALSARLYGNLPLLGLAGITYSQMAATHSSFRDRITFNVCQSVTDTITSRIAKNKPKPMFLTSGGDSTMRRKAKHLNKFTEGVFYEAEVERNSVNRFRDGCVFGDGIDYVYEENDRVKHERVIPSELYVDEVEGFYGSPRQMHRVKAVDRDVLCDRYPEKKGKIRDAKRASDDDQGYLQNVSDLVLVRESWHLPSGPEAKDGKRVVSIDGELLTPVVEWNHSFFPFACFQWSRRLYGYWGQGLVEQIQNIQTEINKLLWVIQRSFHLAGSYKVMVKMGSKVVKEHLDNTVGAIVNWAGDTPPQYIVPQIVPPEIFQHLMTLTQKAYDMAGISMLQATSQKPAGLNSGKALREYDDINTDRFSTVSQAYQNYHLDLARLDIACAKDIAERNGGNYPVKVPGRRGFTIENWEDIDLVDDEFIMKCYPISSLPNTPEGRLQTVQEYIQAGIYSLRTGKKLLDFPDLEQVDTLQDVSEEVLTEVLDNIIEKGEFTPPEPDDDLQLAKELTLQYLKQGRIDKLEPEKMEMLRRFNSQLDMYAQKQMQAQQQQMQQQAALAMAMSGKGPQANPQATPQSELVQNVPGNGAAA